MLRAQALGRCVRDEEAAVLSAPRSGGASSPPISSPETADAEGCRTLVESVLKSRTCACWPARPKAAIDASRPSPGVLARPSGPFARTIFLRAGGSRDLVSGRRALGGFRALVSAIVHAGAAVRRQRGFHRAGRINQGPGVRSPVCLHEPPPARNAALVGPRCQPVVGLTVVVEVIVPSFLMPRAKRSFEPGLSRQRQAGFSTSTNRSGRRSRACPPQADGGNRARRSPVTRSAGGHGRG